MARYYTNQMHWKKKYSMNKILVSFAITLMLAGSVFADDYVIGDGDTLQVSVWGSPELSITTTVRPDGKISLPAMGEIRASGLTTMELMNLLKEELTKVVKAPNVTVIVMNATNYQIYVIGKGVTPGVVILRRETTLLQFLSQLGNLENADLGKAYLVRDKKKIKEGFSALFEEGDFSQDITLKPDDMIFIPDNFDKRVSIVGEVVKPATMPYRTGLSVLDMIVAAEGFTKYANENNVTILRNYRGGTTYVSNIINSNMAIIINKKDDERMKISIDVKKLMKGDMSENISLLPGDIVVVKDDIF